MEEREHNI